VQVLDLDDLLAVLLLEQVDRLAAHHPGDAPAPGDDLDPLAHQDLGVPATNVREVEAPLVVDVGDDQADLVDVADHRQQRAVGLSLNPRHRRAQRVAGNLRELLGGASPHSGGRGLVAGRPGCGQQLAKDLGRGHGRGSLAAPRAAPPRVRSGSACRGDA
jgi:hypothetical protein